MISVIIPVYNVKEYLEKCVCSVIIQTYRELEIILVDDGSTDGSGYLCDELQKKDQRIKVIHKENGGLSDARNVGFKFANGEYVFFLDSDDWICEDALEILYCLLKEENADIAVGNYYYQYDIHKTSAAKLEKNMVFSKDEAMKALLKNDIIKNFAWGKLYKKELLNDYPFPVGKLFEDSYWTHLIFHQADKVVLSKKEIVFYYQRKNSISYTFDIRKLHLIEGCLCRREFVQQNYEYLLYLIDETIISVLIGLYMDSIKHFQWKTHRVLKKEILKVCCEYQEEFNRDVYMDVHKLKEFNLFCKSSKLYIVKFILKKAKEKCHI